MNVTGREIRRIDSYKTQDNKLYHCLFLPEAKIALAIGAFQVNDTSGVKGDICIDATSEEEARRGIHSVLAPGDFI